MAEDNKIIAELIVNGVDKFKSELASVNTPIDNLKKDVKGVGDEGFKSFDKLKDEVKKAGDEVEKTEKKTTSYKNQLKTMRQEIVSLTIELNKMRDAGKQGTKEFNDLDAKIKSLTNDAGQLDDAISDVSGTIKNAGSDTRGLDRTLRVVQSVGAGFQLAQGAAALFGSENKELANALIKLNGIMAVTSSLQQLQDELLKEDSVLTGVASVAKRAYGSAVAFATGATTAFGVALRALGLGLFVGGIALLVANWNKLREAIFGTASETERLIKVKEKALEQSKKTLESLEQELRYQVAIGKLTEAQAIQKTIDAQKKAEEQAKSIQDAQLKRYKELLIASKTYTRHQVSQSQFGGGGSGESLTVGATQKQVNEQALLFNKSKKDYQDLVISRIENQKKLEELNKKEIDKPIKDTIKSIKELKDLLPIKFDIEPNLDKFDEYLSSLITTAETQLKSLFTAELLLGNNPQENPQIRYLITQIQKYKDELDLAKMKFDALNPSEIKPIGLQEITDSFKTLDGISKIEVSKPLTFWERLFGTKQENQTEEQLQQDRIKKAQYIIGQINDIGAGIGDVATKAIALRANAELTALEEKKKKGLISEKEYEKESAKIKNEAAEKQRKVDIAMAVAKVPMAVLQALSSAPPPANYALAAVAGGLALAQVAILSASPLPKFKEGGSVEKRFKGSGYVVGKPHEQGGVNAELEGNEYVIKGNAVRKYGVRFLDEVNSLKFNPVLSMPKKALSYHKKDTKMYEHMAIIASYLKQGYKEESKGNNILREISNKINNKREYV